MKITFRLPGVDLVSEMASAQWGLRRYLDKHAEDIRPRLRDFVAVTDLQTNKAVLVYGVPGNLKVKVQ